MSGNVLKCQSKPQESRVEKNPPHKPLGRWLVDNMPCGANLEIPGDRNESGREVSFLNADCAGFGESGV